MNDRISSDPRRSRVFLRCARRAGVLLALSGLASGCSPGWNPFITAESDLGMLPPITKTRLIDRLAPESYAVAPERQAEEERSRAPRPNPFEGLERTDVSVEQARAWTLEHNLDLQVALVDPAIANESLNEEEGRFESVFFTNTRYTSLNQPTSTTLAGSEVENFDLDAGVRIPLRTGGTATINLPVNRNETNNVFSTLNPSYSTDAVFSISQPLLRSAGRRAATYGVRIASLNKQASLARTKLEVIRQLAAVERSYWRLYAFRKALEVRQQQYELADEQLGRARRRVQAGQDAEIEIVRAEAGVAERLEAIIIAENDVRNFQRDFKRILNLPGLGIETPTMIVTATPPDPVKYEFDPAELADRAVANRMEMLELELRLAQDESTVAFERNRALPLFTLDYQYRINGLGPDLGESFDLLGDARFEDHVVSATVEVPLGNVQARSRVERAVLTRLQRLSSKDARALAIRQETLNAIDAVEAGWSRILAARQSTIANTRAYNGEQRQYEIGRRTSTDVLDASTRLADSQLAEIRAVAEYQVSLIDLAFATGSLLGASRVTWDPLDPRPNPREPDLIWGIHPIAEPIEGSASEEAATTEAEAVTIEPPVPVPPPRDQDVPVPSAAPAMDNPPPPADPPPPNPAPGSR